MFQYTFTNNGSECSVTILAEADFMGRAQLEIAVDGQLLKSETHPDDEYSNGREVVRDLIAAGYPFENARSAFIVSEVIDGMIDGMVEIRDEADGAIVASADGLTEEGAAKWLARFGIVVAAPEPEPAAKAGTLPGIRFDQPMTVGGHTFRAGTEFYIVAAHGGKCREKALSLTPFTNGQLQVVNPRAWAERFGGEFVRLPNRTEWRRLHDEG